MSFGEYIISRIVDAGLGGLVQGVLFFLIALLIILAKKLISHIVKSNKEKEKSIKINWEIVAGIFMIVLVILSIVYMHSIGKI